MKLSNGQLFSIVDVDGIGLFTTFDCDDNTAFFIIYKP